MLTLYQLSYSMRDFLALGGLEPPTINGAYIITTNLGVINF